MQVSLQVTRLKVQCFMIQWCMTQVPYVNVFFLYSASSGSLSPTSPSHLPPYPLSLPVGEPRHTSSSRNTTLLASSGKE